MDLHLAQAENALVMTLSGKLDTLTAPTYEASVMRAVDDGAGYVVLDFGELVYISSAGLRSLLTTAKALKANGGALLLANVHGNVRDVFEMAGFSAIFTTYGSVPAALEAC